MRRIGLGLGLGLGFGTRACVDDMAYGFMGCMGRLRGSTRRTARGHIRAQHQASTSDQADGVRLQAAINGSAGMPADGGAAV